ncbi:MAG: hypothetical protein PHX78_01665 [bacterium]|nr:hypothetical protein [bacterium]
MKTIYCGIKSIVTIPIWIGLTLLSTSAVFAMIILSKAREKKA